MSVVDKLQATPVNALLAAMEARAEPEAPVAAALAVLLIPYST